MGKPTTTTNNHNQIQSTITHFSHPHPLQTLTNQTLARASCSGCKSGFSSGGTIYGCTTCSFFLHALCSKLPQQIKHPVDPAHVLVLLAVPVYPQGFFNCNACSKPGNGFSYHCRACGIDLHTNCASMPLSLTHPSHPHQLTLAFAAPYPNRMFSCDVCATHGTAQWLYRCAPCGFDSHILCTGTAFTSPQNPNPSPNPNHNNNNVTRQLIAPPPSVQTSYYDPQQCNLAAQNLIMQQQLMQQQIAAAAAAQIYSGQTMGLNPMVRNFRANNNLGGNQLQGLFSGLQNILGGGGGGGGGMFDPSAGGGGGGGGFDFGGGGMEDLGNPGGIDFGSLGGMDLGSLGDISGGFGDFSF